jgi:hypothetical protein
MSEVAAWELRRRQSVSEQLKKIGVSAGVLQRMARAGQLIKLQCETPKCYCDKGRRFFPDPPVPNSPWGPTIDHYPILKSLGGTKTPENVRLAHKRCNEDFAWRERIARSMRDGRSLVEIAEDLNRKGIECPSNAARWTPTRVRWMFVTG